MILDMYIIIELLVYKFYDYEIYFIIELFEAYFRVAKPFSGGGQNAPFAPS